MKDEKLKTKTQEELQGKPKKMIFGGPDNNSKEGGVFDKPVTDEVTLAELNKLIESE